MGRESEREGKLMVESEKGGLSGRESVAEKRGEGWGGGTAIYRNL